MKQCEELVARSLRSVLECNAPGDTVLESDQLHEVLSGLEYFIPHVLGEVYPEWKHEGLDAVFSLRTTAIDAHTAEIFGQCIVLSSQRVTPLHVRVRLARSRDEIECLECQIGERDEDGLLGTPYEGPTRRLAQLLALDGRLADIEWAYRVGFDDAGP